MYRVSSSSLKYSPVSSRSCACDGDFGSSSFACWRPRYESCTGRPATVRNVIGALYDATQNEVSDRALIGHSGSRDACVLSMEPSRRMRTYQPGPSRYSPA